MLRFEAEKLFAAAIDKPLAFVSWRSNYNDWPAAGLVDTEKRCFMKLEVGYGEASIQS